MRYLFIILFLLSPFCIYSNTFSLKNISAQKIVEEYVKRDALGNFLKNNDKKNEIYVISFYKISTTESNRFSVEYIVEGKMIDSKFLKNKEKKIEHFLIETTSDGHQLNYLDFHYVFTSVILKKFHSRLDEESKKNLQIVINESKVNQKKPSLIKTIIQKKVLWKTLSL